MLVPEELEQQPSKRRICNSEKSIDILSKAGIQVPKIYEVLKQEFLKISCNKNEIHNYIQKVFPNNHENNAKTFVLLLKEKKDENLEFMYEYSLDEYNQLDNYFWMHSESQ